MPSGPLSRGLFSSHRESTLMSKFRFRGKMLESEPASLRADEISIAEADGILARVLSSVSEGARDSWLRLCPPGWVEPRRLKPGRHQLAKGPRAQRQDAGSRHQRLQGEHTPRGASQQHQAQPRGKIDGTSAQTGLLAWLQGRPEPTDGAIGRGRERCRPRTRQSKTACPCTTALSLTPVC